MSKFQIVKDRLPYAARRIGNLIKPAAKTYYGWLKSHPKKTLLGTAVAAVLLFPETMGRFLTNLVVGGAEKFAKSIGVTVKSSDTANSVAGVAQNLSGGAVPPQTSELATWAAGSPEALAAAAAVATYGLFRMVGFKKVSIIPAFAMAALTYSNNVTFDSMRKRGTTETIDIITSQAGSFLSKHTGINRGTLTEEGLDTVFGDLCSPGKQSLNEWAGVPISREHCRNKKPSPR